jgi:iron complex outermembrane receptor protein
VVSRFVAGAAGAVGILAVQSGAAQADALENVANLSIEELMELEVTSVSRRPERLIEAPAAIQVITGDDIRRSGATSLPAALHLAGNLDVAQKNAHEWIISARGFSSDVGNKLLVMMDGRTVYTPLFSGVFWDRQDYVLEDIERIEAISGPGGALWGANAVNGVINITTKSAEASQGLYAEGGGGTNPQGFAGLRYGGAFSPDAFYRVYGKYTDRRSEDLAGGASANDSWYAAQGGFRIDARVGGDDQVTLQGDMYYNKEGIVAGGDAETRGANILARWSRTLSETSDISLQVYYDRTHLSLPVPAAFFAPAGRLRDDLDTIDVDFQHRFQIGERHRFVWGLGYRFTHDVLDNAPGLAFFPAKLNQSLYSAFLQDEISLADNLVLTLGSKLEHMPYTGFEIEPSARLQWSLTDQQTLWGGDLARGARAVAHRPRHLTARSGLPPRHPERRRGVSVGNPAGL